MPSNFSRDKRGGAADCRVDGHLRRARYSGFGARWVTRYRRVEGLGVPDVDDVDARGSERDVSVDELLDRAVAAINRGDRMAATGAGRAGVGRRRGQRRGRGPALFPGSSGEIRRLTILFADLVDSTALSTRVEPETYRMLVGRYRDQVLGIVNRYDGHIASTKGDGLRFDNGIWNGHSRKRGVECTIEGKTPLVRKITMNNHYNGTFLEPWGERSQRGYGVEVLERFAREVALVEFGGPADQRAARLEQARQLQYNDISADRQVVAAVQAMEAILARHAEGQPNCVVEVDHPSGGLVLFAPGLSEPEVLYSGRVGAKT